MPSGGAWKEPCPDALARQADRQHPRTQRWRDMKTVAGSRRGRAPTGEMHAGLREPEGRGQAIQEEEDLQGGGSTWAQGVHSQEQGDEHSGRSEGWTRLNGHEEAPQLSALTKAAVGTKGEACHRGEKRSTLNFTVTVVGRVLRR